jgi:hypothetical protein
MEPWQLSNLGHQASRSNDGCKEPGDDPPKCTRCMSSVFRDAILVARM